ncbi:hypothetical protein [Bradyrhizobium sp. Ash2021]|uniref:hypothetical protein n=1 Tax=Bradyrhizobium sp. Ash2021 TaxID=2954771 RepID=UPI002816129C|nr:hypothetical protein [Bradyrhizobium sp. Ash2021]WMT79376.1 hypothetical protein NL528_06580 [Bradyrhizobium sp. Ash2021]
MAHRKGPDLAVEVENTFEAAAAGIPLTGPLSVGFDAQHHMTQLPVVAELTAGHGPARQNMADARELGSADKILVEVSLPKLYPALTPA